MLNRSGSVVYIYTMYEVAVRKSIGFVPLPGRVVHRPCPPQPFDETRSPPVSLGVFPPDSLGRARYQHQTNQ